MSYLGSFKAFSHAGALAVFPISSVSGFIGKNAFSKTRIDVKEIRIVYGVLNRKLEKMNRF